MWFQLLCRHRVLVVQKRLGRGDTRSSALCLIEGLHRLEAAKALGEKTIVGFRVDARKH